MCTFHSHIETSDPTDNTYDVNRTKELNTEGTFQKIGQVKEDIKQCNIKEDERESLDLNTPAPVDRVEQRTCSESEEGDKSSSTEDVDDTVSPASSTASKSSSEFDSPQPKPHRTLQSVGVQSAESGSELCGDFKSRILGRSAAPPRDLTKKGRSPGPEQVDFRGHLKKTGLRADKDLTAQGKKQVELREGKFKVQLGITGANTSQSLLSAKKTGGTSRVDFRGLLNKKSGDGYVRGRNLASHTPPPTYLSKRTESEVSLQSSQVSSGTTTRESTPKQEAVKKEGRKISSSDLLNMLHKPVETSNQSFLVQRGIKKAETQKPCSGQKFVTPAVRNTEEVDSFKVRMAERKKRSEKNFLPSDTRAVRKQSGDETRKDFRSALKPVGGTRSRLLSKEKEQDSEGQALENNSSSNEQPSTVASKTASPSGALKW